MRRMAALCGDGAGGVMDDAARKEIAPEAASTAPGARVYRSVMIVSRAGRDDKWKLA